MRPNICSTAGGSAAGIPSYGYVSPSHSGRCHTHSWHSRPGHHACASHHASFRERITRRAGYQAIGRAVDIQQSNGVVVQMNARQLPLLGGNGSCNQKKHTDYCESYEQWPAISYLVHCRVLSLIQIPALPRLKIPSMLLITCQCHERSDFFHCLVYHIRPILFKPSPQPTQYSRGAKSATSSARYSTCWRSDRRRSPGANLASDSSSMCSPPW